MSTAQKSRGDGGDEHIMCYCWSMYKRRPAPPNFDSRVNRLLELEKIITEGQREYDEVLIDLLVVDQAPSTTIAERFGVPPQTITHRRKMALKRRDRREAELQK